MRSKAVSTHKQHLRHAGSFPVVVQEDISGGYWVTCPPLVGCVSQGDTIDEALRNIKEAIQLCLEDETSQGKKIATQPASFHVVDV